MLKPLNMVMLCSLAVMAGTAAGASHDTLGCGSCHIAHTPAEAVSSGALWNLKQVDDGMTVFRLYSSPSFDALGTDIGQPDGDVGLAFIA